MKLTVVLEVVDRLERIVSVQFLGVGFRAESRPFTISLEKNCW